VSEKNIDALPVAVSARNEKRRKPLLFFLFLFLLLPSSSSSFSAAAAAAVAVVAGGGGGGSVIDGESSRRASQRQGTYEALKGGVILTRYGRDDFFSSALPLLPLLAGAGRCRCCL